MQITCVRVLFLNWMITFIKSLNILTKKPGRGLATIKVKALDLRTGANIEKSFSSSERVQDVRLDYHQVEYLYNDGQFYYFMDLETFEQPAIPKDVLGDTVNYLTENLQVKLTFFETEPLDIDLPTSVDLEVVESFAGCAW